PGVDAQAREDQGRIDGPVSVAGFVIGDDYVARAPALEAARAVRRRAAAAEAARATRGASPGVV
ncbi:MAG: hypothetical protein ACK4NU_05485, partial [Brevundimonas sp.]